MTTEGKVVGGQDVAVRDELLHRMATDQRARLAVMPLFASAVDGAVGPENVTLEERALFDRLAEVDEDNTRWLRDFVQRRGWPTRSMVGKEGARAAWLLAQHGDRDPAWQRRCLDLMLAAPDDEVSPTDIAYLTDRVLLAESKPQIYGTQMRLTNGEYQPLDLRDPDTVDERRAAVGLGTLEEYQQQMNEEEPTQPSS